MADLLPARVTTILSKINRIASVTAEGDEENEWFHLQSMLSDSMLYKLLKANWGQIAPPGAGFALAYCHFGEGSGVWLHFLSTPRLIAEYEEGCHETLQW